MTKVIVGGGSSVSLRGTIKPGIEDIIAGDNITIDKTDPKNPIISSSGGGGGGVAIADTYPTVADLLADQADQDENKWYLVHDAYDDPTVDSGWAIYQYLGTTDGNLGDYLKVGEQESLDVSINDATPSVKGIAKLYSDLSASNTDGSVTQAGVKTVIELLQFPPGRSISSDAAVVQSDNNSILFLNGTFNITVDALVQWTTISILNEGAGTITLINGTGVTFTGPSSIASGETAMILYKTSTAPVVIKSGGGSGSVTSVGLTTGTTGTDVNVSGSPVTSSGVITLNIPTSSATNRGLLNSSDWSTFNSKQSAITFGTGVQTWIGTPSWANFLAAITGTSPYYSLANGGTLTGVNTITSNAVNQLIKAGTFTAIASGNFFERIAPVMTAFGGTPNELYGVQIRPTMNAVGSNGIQIALDVSPTFSGGTSPYNAALRVQGLSIFNTANSSGYNGVLYAPTAGTAGRVAIFGNLEITTSAGPGWTAVGIQVPGSGRPVSIWGAQLSNVLDFASIVLKANAYSANRAGADLSIVSIDQPSYTLTTFTANSLSLLSSTSAWPILTTPLTTAYGINLSPSAPGNATTNVAINTNANAGRVQFGHDVKLMNVGSGFYIKEGTNATMGVATLVAGTVTVNTNKVTANSRIMLTRQNLGTITVPVGLAISARTAGTSFTILSGDLTDTSQVAWQILEPS